MNLTTHSKTCLFLVWKLDLPGQTASSIKVLIMIDLCLCFLCVRGHHVKYPSTLAILCSSSQFMTLSTFVFSAGNQFPHWSGCIVHFSRLSLNVTSSGRGLLVPKEGWLSLSSWYFLARKWNRSLSYQTENKYSDHSDTASMNNIINTLR